MATRESPRRAFWLEHLAKAREHGGPLKAYADANGLSAGALYAAKSAYKDRTHTTRANTNGAARLLPVQLGAVSASASIRIALPNGVRIEVPGALSVEQWRPLLALLSSGA